MKYRLNLDFLVEIWVFFVGFWNFTCRDLGFSPEFGFFFGQFRFFGFWGIEIETNLSESVSGGEDPPSTVGIVGSIGFGSVPVGSSG